MKYFAILYKPRSLDDRVELELIEEVSNNAAMFKWLELNKGTSKHCSGYLNDSIDENDIELFNSDYESFRNKYFKPSIYFDYN